MSNIAKPSSATKTVVKEVKVESRLSEESSPTLTNNLNANGNDIVGVENVEVKRINGEYVGDMMLSGIKEAKDYANVQCAPKKHRHNPSDITDLDTLIVGTCATAISEVTKKVNEDFAKKEHTHNARDIPDINVSIEAVVGNLPVVEHSHKDLSDKIAKVAAELPNMANLGYVDSRINTLEKLIDDCNKAAAETKRDMETLRNVLSAIAKQVDTASKITIKIEPEAKETVRTVVSDVPYVIVDNLSGKDGIVVADSFGTQLETEVIGNLVNFKRTKGPYTLTINRNAK